MGLRYDLVFERGFFRNPTQNLVLKGTIVGDFDKTRFEQAVLELGKVHPILHCVVEQSKDGKVSYVYQEGVNPQVTYLEKENESQWIELAKQQEHVIFEFEKEPTIHFFILSQEKEFDFIMIGHHMLGDGLSHLYLYHDFIEFYCNGKKNMELKEPKPIQSIMDLPKGSQPSFLIRYVIKRLNRRWAKNRKILTQSEFQVAHQNYQKKQNIDVALFYLKGDEYQKLRQSAKDHQITMNTVILVAFMKALKELTEFSEEKVTVAINLRNRLLFHPGRCVGNYAAAITKVLSYDMEKDFWKNANSLGSIIKKEIQNPKKAFQLVHLFCLLDSSIFDGLFYSKHSDYKNDWLNKVSKLLNFKDYEEGIDISNLGVFDVSLNTEKYQIKDMAYLPPAASVYDKTIGVITYQDELAICISHKVNFLAKDKMERIMNRTKEILLELN
ncbi:MAG TPA: hypothetical protein DHW61_00380 [Lachnoclostridium phytofermentans]|uniref:Condensation domain-containing protein n=1 Tax=Lachnoclostridium phytofermentans TaxID=66219 RepID=A0A3D2X2E1_9FIRM|nr:condensation domain-containing protein [Lachnoclostridium sp.]HCL00877.1 hypothetical protein [Lachnoclostridium phytofermentans]